MRSTPGVNVQIRPLAAEEIELLEITLPALPPAAHRQRFAQQQEGDAVYLIAWHEGSPVGHALLLWGGPAHEPMASQLTGCPVLEDLLVHPAYRSRGIGSQIMDAAEDAVRERGYSRLGLAVGLDNARARALYEHRGYELSPFGRFSHEALSVDEQGWWHRQRESDVFLIKELGR